MYPTTRRPLTSTWRIWRTMQASCLCLATSAVASPPSLTVPLRNASVALLWCRRSPSSSIGGAGCWGGSWRCWPNKEEAQLSLHHPRSLTVDRNTEVTQDGTQIRVNNPSGYARGHLTLTLESPEEAGVWVACLRQHAEDHRLWGAAAEEDMEILTPQPARHNFLLPRRSRFASLYEETPLRDGSPVSDKSSLDDIYTSSGFVSNYCTPAPSLPPRTRALTLSSRGSFRRWGSVRCNMPFFKSKS
ncbi:uncharacterized protein LOC135094124 isoform X2 [Scylla paramamosain]|uniref:uncharacterized protein LOC135094124 isoform X2 n=1 Tax=Scylla paramamosain TaxID=85552 RepID=UPI0030834A54